MFFSYIFFYRVFLTKLPRDINEFNIVLLIIGCIIIFIQSIMLIITIMPFFKFKDKKKTFFLSQIKKLKKIMKRFRRKNIHKEDLKFLFNLKENIQINERIENYYAIFLRNMFQYSYISYLYYKFAYAFRKIFSFNYVIYMHFLIFILPKLFGKIIFFLEVIIFKEINYFYKVLWVLIIPIIGKFIRVTCKYFAIMQHNYFATTIYIRKMVVEEDAILNMEYSYDEQDDTTYKYTWYIPELHKLHDITSLHQQFGFHLQFIKMYDFMEISYDLEHENFMFKIINIFITLLTISSWTYVILYMLKIIS